MYPDALVKHVETVVRKPADTVEAMSAFEVKAGIDIVTSKSNKPRGFYIS
jgi:hypothetical protein